MNFIETIKERAKKDKKKIVLPEGMDKRTYEAAVMARDEKIADVIVIASEDEILANAEGMDLSGITVIDPRKENYTDELIDKLVEIRKNKGLTREEAKDLLLNDYMYYACMLVKTGRADGVVSGACHSTSNTLRPALQIIKTKPDVELVSAFFLMVVPDCEYVENGTFIFADSGLEQNPDPSRLAAIAGSSAESFKLLVDKEPLVAMLSHSTKGSAKHADVDKVVEASRLAKERYPQYQIDGELQLDAAIVPEVAEFKAKGSPLKGQANVLVFPDLGAGNIGYKLTQRLAKAEAYGPLCQGIAKPVNDLSRGCSSEDVAGVVAITAVQAQNQN